VWGLALILLTFPHLEDFGAWLNVDNSWRLKMRFILLISDLLRLILLSSLRARLRIPVDRSAALFLAGFCVAYLLMPLIHHTIGTDGYFYLTNSDDFFARSLGIQFLAWLITALVAWEIVRIRLALAAKREPDVEGPGSSFTKFAS
jgi:hypothetical protein